MPTVIGRDEVRKLTGQHAQLVEVLPVDEYDWAHLPGAVNIPLKELDARTLLPAYFWWTACLLTPSRPAIAFHVQPLARALSTCNASRTSTRARSAATAA